MDRKDRARRLEEILDSIRKPLAFASKDNFIHLNSVKGIAQLVGVLCDEALSLDGGVARFGELKGLFTGFDALDAEEKKEKIKRGMELLSAPDQRPAEEATVISPEEAKKRLKALTTPLAYVKGIGPKLAERLAKKGLTTVEDMLYYLPIRYEDRKEIKKIKDLAPGMQATVVAEALAQGEVRYGARRVYEIAASDGTSILKLKWFNFKSSYMKDRYKNGRKFLIYGTVSVYGGQKELIHPDLEPFEEDGEAPAGIVPVYSQIENFHQKTIRKIINSIVDGYSEDAVSAVPPETLKRCGLKSLPRALREIHQPHDKASQAAKKSLAFDELFTLEVGLALKRRQIKKESGISFAASTGALEEKLKKMLPFALTGAQKRVLTEIKRDMAAPHPMNRLIQGDVGSGKTVVSFIAALNAIDAGYQAAIMAPTEILSEQHYLNIHRYAEALGISAVILTGNAKKSERKAALEAIKNGDVDLVVGTHALIQKDVEFKNLGLAVIDEQHRFGVVQRAALKKKGFGAERGLSPDILIMTATPIPRTLSMTVFGDLDVSVIDELPPGRRPVNTKILRESERPKAYERIRREVSGGSQCYIVYPLVEESEELSLKDATNMKHHLESSVFPEFRVGLLHGRMKAAEKESVMKDFKDRRLDILVATTVIEVGVDVPNATVMLVEHAERFGLAQLHQLRGRVGRGVKESICLLLAAWTNSEDTYKRLKVMEATQDGFKIAEEDLKIRGPGDFLGTRQAGLPDFRLSEALTDLGLLKKAREEALCFMEKEPGLKGPQGAIIKEVLKARWEGRLELAEIG